MTMPVVLLPGLDGTGDLFAPLVAAAPAHLEPVVVPLPPLSKYSELVDHIRPALPPAPRFAILGESFSGPLAIALARAEPSRVAGVILCNSFLSPPLSALLRFLPWSLLFRVPPPRWVIRRFFVGPAASPELVSAVRAAIGRTPRDVLAARMIEVFLLPRKPEPIDVPALLLTGRDDRMIRRKPGVEGDVVSKTIAGPHLLLQVSPHEAWREISAFLDRPRTA
jgi:pimeloyl-[acyl-carrier protein] methyl ester esterase